MIRLAYLHGFGSSPLGVKAQALSRFMADQGLALELPDLNQPSFAQLTYSGALAELDRLHEQAPQARWRLVGSSMGGYLAARWAELHLERVERLLLLCPGFDLASRWPVMLGSEVFERWERRGSLPMADPEGRVVSLSWNFIEDARRHPPIPQPSCPAVLIHGRQDDVVPLRSSQAWAAGRRDTQLIEVNDDHRLLGSLGLIQTELHRLALA